MREDLIEGKEKILEMVLNERPKSEICRLFKCKQVTLNSYLKKFGIEYKGNIGRKGIQHIELRKEASFYLNDFNFIGSYKLKLKLLQDGIKEYKCENCNLSEWLGKPIPIELHHIDGDRFNNNLNNLQILCPNCHSLTDNNSGKGMKKSSSKRKNVIPLYLESVYKNNLCRCGKEIRKRSKKCEDCSKFDMRKTIRPPYEQLLKDIDESNYCAVGRKYGVSDNAIRKWIKKYKNDKCRGLVENSQLS